MLPTQAPPSVDQVPRALPSVLLPQRGCEALPQSTLQQVVPQQRKPRGSLGCCYRAGASGEPFLGRAACVPEPWAQRLNYSRGLLRTVGDLSPFLCPCI